MSQVDKIEQFTGNPLEMLTRLRQVTSCPSILSSTVVDNIKFDRLEDLLESLPQGDKAVVFSNWSSVIEEAAKRLQAYSPLVITGKTPQIERINRLDKFKKNKDCKVLLGTTGALGTGFTITEANTVIFIDEPWNSALKEQAEDRCHRIGTTSTVSVHTLVIKDTVDEKVYRLIGDKKKLSDAMIDDKLEFILDMLN
jgi:SNF2 family DNA or RNA helicase